MKQSDEVHVETWAVGAGRGTEDAGTPLNVPPVLASNFKMGGSRAYSRDHATPTWEAFEEVVGGMEGGLAVSFSSGMATAASVFDLLPAGALVLLAEDCYQGVAGLVSEGEDAGKWRVERADIEDTQRWLDLSKSADLLWIESPSNPLLGVADLPSIAAAERKPGSLLAVDSTLATPLAQRPLQLGADLVVHSATKYLGGHSDLLMGVAVAAHKPLAERLIKRRELAGATPGALEAYLALRGIRTLPVRFARANATAAELAKRLNAHDQVEVVRYPGLPGHPTLETATGFMQAFGALIAFDVAGGADVADALCREVSVFTHATSLGGVESTIERRAAVPGQEHHPAGLVRLSVGCEHIEDLWADLLSALARICD